MSYELYHHGILGMKWGVRRFQNEDGTLTSAGKKRYDFKEVAQKAKNRVKAFGTSKTVKRFAGRSGIGGIIVKTKLAQLGFSVVTYAESKYLENMGHERLSRLVFEFGNAGAAYLEALGITAAVQRGRKRI